VKEQWPTADEEPDRSRNAVQAAKEILGRRGWLALLTFLGVATAVFSVVGFLPDVYRSSATVLIDRQQIPDELVRSTVTSNLEVRLHTITQEILSRSRLEALIERFGLYSQLRRRAPVEEVVQRMRDDIRLELKSGERRGDRATVAFSISYVGADPQKVALVTNTLASFYIEENLKARERQAAGTAEFLRVQLEAMGEKLEQQEQQVSQFKERHIGELPQQLEANLSSLEQLNGQLRINSDYQIQVAERRAALQKQLEEEEAKAGPGSPRATAERLAALEKELTALRTRYSDKYPDVARVKMEIEALRKQQASEAAGTGPPKPSAGTAQAVQLRTSIAELDARARSLQAEADALRRALSRYQQRVENVPRTEQEFARLARDYETSKELYRSLLMRQREAEVAESMEQRQKGEQFRVIESAIAAERPSAPDRPTLIGLGLLLALGLAAAVVLVAEQLDTSFHSVDDLRLQARLPVLASIPRIATPAGMAQRRRRLGLAAMATAVSLALIVGGAYLAAANDGPLAGAILRAAQ
jgi:succinoglycan biosynthesis transport protein ExoP